MCPFRLNTASVLYRSSFSCVVLTTHLLQSTIKYKAKSLKDSIMKQISQYRGENFIIFKCACRHALANKIYKRRGIYVIKVYFHALFVACLALTCQIQQRFESRLRC